MNFLKKDEIEEAYFEDSLANVLFKNRTFSRYGLDIGCCTDRFCSVRERVLSYAPCYGFWESIGTHERDSIPGFDALCLTPPVLLYPSHIHRQVHHARRISAFKFN